jgi:hypothetical protein
LSKLENETNNSQGVPHYVCILIKENICTTVFAEIIDIDISLIDL